jgi:DNA-binding NarL/FixJ family response regulator
VSVTVLIADDQPLMRVALALSLEAEPDITVVGQAADGLQAVDLATRLDPDVIVMDIRMPGLDGVQATRRLTAGPGAPRKVLIMTTFDLDEYVVAALRAGASGFLLKDATSQELIHAVRVIAAGDALLAPSITRRLLDGYARRLPLPPSITAAGSAEITRRELAVLLHVARGLSNAEIAAALFVAESSVKTHVGHLLAKLQRHDRVQLVIYAYETGLVTAGRANGEPDLSW